MGACRSAVVSIALIAPAAVAACLSFGDLSGGAPSTGDAASAVDASSEASSDSAIGSTSSVIEIAGGVDSACAVLNDDTVWCWGNKSVGQLGVAPGSAGASCVVNGSPVPCQPTPTQIPAFSGVAHVSVGTGHACAIKIDGTVWCWGQNDHGQLGHASATNGDIICGGGLACNATPSQVAGLSNISQISAGAGFTCAVDVTGDLKCWGKNGLGELGDGNPTPSEADVPAPLQVLGMGSGVAEVATSGATEDTCARKTDGTVWCWGNNTYGQAGHTPDTLGDQTYIFLAFGHVPHLVGAGVDGGGENVIHDATQIAFANQVACALGAGGVPYCWGSGNQGMLGNDDGGLVGHPTPQTIAGLTATFKSISGHSTNFCGIDAANQIWCWGLTDLGQIGNGSTSSASGAVPCTSPCEITPTMIPSFAASSISSFTGSFAIGVDGGLFGWGPNEHGELGHAPASNGDQTCFLPDASVACAQSPVRVLVSP